MDFSNILNIFISSLAVYVVLIVFVRIAGLGSFSQMTAVDYAVTIAIGAILSTAILPSNPSVFESCLALGILLLIQWIVSFVRRRSDGFRKVVDNSPLLIMRDGKILEKNLQEANITKADLIAKLRESNAYHFADIKAVIFESTGEISVLHGEKPVDDVIFYNVKE